jgi:hypothetical protein
MATDQRVFNAPVQANKARHDHGFAAFLCCSSRHACSRAAASGGKISDGKSGGLEHLANLDHLAVREGDARGPYDRLSL